MSDQLANVLSSVIRKSEHPQFFWAAPKVYAPFFRNVRFDTHSLPQPGSIEQSSCVRCCRPASAEQTVAMRDDPIVNIPEPDALDRWPRLLRLHHRDRRGRQRRTAVQRSGAVVGDVQIAIVSGAAGAVVRYGQQMLHTARE